MGFLEEGSEFMVAMGGEWARHSRQREQQTQRCWAPGSEGWTVGLVMPSMQWGRQELRLAW